MLRYDAFISYSHAVDGQLAPSLETALERFAKPWYRMRGLRVFRDDTSLTATPGLWTSIQDALDASGAFILMASPGAAGSQWVARELEHWLADRPPERLLLVLTDGDLVWDDRRAGFDWDRTTAIPRVLDGVFAEEPRWTDVRWARTREHLSIRDPRFREAVADVAAPIHGRPKDELIGEEVRQHRRTVRLAGAAVGALALLAAVAAVAAVVAIRGQATAREERDRAQAQARLATSRQLAAQSESVSGDGAADLALLLAAQAVRFQSTPEARGSLFAALDSVPRVGRMVKFPDAVLSEDGRVLARAVPSEGIEVRPVERAEAIQRYPAPDEIFGFGVSPDGTTVAVTDESGAVTIQGAAADGEAVRFPGPPGGIGEEGPFHGTEFAFARGHPLVAWNGVDISLWNGRRLRTLPNPVGAQPGAWRLAFSHDDGLLAAASDSVGTVIVWEIAPDGAPVGTPRVFQAGSGRAEYLGFGEGVASVAFSPTERGRLAIGGFDGSVSLWDAETQSRVASTGDGSGAAEVHFSPDGQRLVASDDRRIRLWDVAGWRVTTSFPAYDWAGSPVFLADSHTLMISGSSSVATVDPGAAPFQLARRLQGRTAGTIDLAYDETGRRLATLSFDEIRLWDAETLRPVGEPRPPGDGIDLVLDREGRLVAWSSIPPRATIWDRQGRARDVGLPAADVVVSAPQGLLAVGSSAGGVKVAVVEGDGRPLTLPRSKGVTPPIAVSPDGRTVVGALPPAEGAFPGAARPLRLWSVDPPRVISRSLPSTTLGGVGFSPSGALLAIAEDRGPVRLVDPKTGRELGTLETGDFVSALAFDQDQRLATLSLENLELWDLRRRQPLATSTFATKTQAGFGGQPQLAFSPDGRSLAVVGLDARPLVFDVDPRSWLATACRVADRNLTEAEWRRFVGPGFPYERTCP